MTKKEKAELAISCPEIRAWVLGHMRCRVKSYGNWVPTDLFEFQPPENIKELPNGKKLFEWLSSTKHLYNADGCVMLMNALLDRIK